MAKDEMHMKSTKRLFDEKKNTSRDHTWRTQARRLGTVRTGPALVRPLAWWVPWFKGSTAAVVWQIFTRNKTNGGRRSPPITFLTYLNPLRSHCFSFLCCHFSAHLFHNFHAFTVQSISTICCVSKIWLNNFFKMILLGIAVRSFSARFAISPVPKQYFFLLQTLVHSTVKLGQELLNPKLPRGSLLTILH